MAAFLPFLEDTLVASVMCCFSPREFIENTNSLVLVYVKTTHNIDVGVFL